MTRVTSLVLAGVALAAAAFVALVAVDVASWRRTIARDDLAYLVSSPAAVTWRVDEVAPFHAARVLLGTQDDVQFRRALRLFRLSRPRDSLVSHPEARTLRAEAQVALTQLLRTEQDPRRRAIAADLLGDLVMASTADVDSATAAQLLTGAVDDFQSAVKLDPANEDAKYNLELSLLQQANDVASAQPSGKPPPGDEGQGAGVGTPGSGY